MNEHSSRSHAIFIITIECSTVQDLDIVFIISAISNITNETRQHFNDPLSITNDCSIVEFDNARYLLSLRVVRYGRLNSMILYMYLVMWMTVR